MFRNYLHYLTLSMLTWLSTNALGASIIAVNKLFGLGFAETLIVSLLFSAPAVFGLIACCYHLRTIRNRRKRITWALLENGAIVALIVICFLILAWRFNEFKYFLRYYPNSLSDYFILIVPFAVSAPLCFLLIANKLIFPSGLRLSLKPNNNAFLSR